MPKNSWEALKDRFKLKILQAESAAATINAQLRLQPMAFNKRPTSVNMTFSFLGSSVTAGHGAWVNCVLYRFLYL